MFSGKNYIGVDMRPGPNVDIVMNGHDLTKFFEPCSFDLVICFDTLEHDDKFWLTVYEMRKVVKSGGWMVIGVPGQNTPLHDHPGDYWRFMQESMGLWFYDFVELFFQEQKDDIAHQFTDEIVGRGRKR
jgi:SAM-dependent methyltransferase